MRVPFQGGMKMRLAFVTKNKSSDISDWSGSNFYIRNSLKNSGFETIFIGSLKEGRHYLSTKVKSFLYRALFSKRYQRLRNPSLLEYFGRQVETSLSPHLYDVVLGTDSCSLSHLQIEKPIVYWTDATFAGMIDYYPDYRNLCAETVRDGNKMEQLTLSKCRLAVFSSQWAADSALKYYDVDPAKIKVVPFGANIECDRDLAAIQKITAHKGFKKCRLLFIGGDWDRKGGDLAVQVAEWLNRQGLPTELHIVGLRPPDAFPPYVKCHGFVSKKTKQGRSLLNTLFEESHFFILPSKAECYGIVFAEASSFGLPSVATNTGGIPTAIHNGKNGQTFSLEDGPDQYGAYILGLMSDKEKYTQLALSSFQEYSERLNWRSSGEKIRSLIHDFYGPKATG
jgi:glycosyltransferase involved in cell wall biosynthesis